MSALREARPGDPLAFARALAALGATVFASEPHPSAVPGSKVDEFRHPTAWSSLKPANNERELARWQPGWAMRVCGGDVCTIIDVDSKAPYLLDPERARALLAHLGVTIFAEVETPSGGRHFYAAGHPDMPTAHRVPGWDGLEILGHGGNAYGPGTSRPAYHGGGYRVLSADLDGLRRGDRSGAEALMGWLAAQRATAPSEGVQGTPAASAVPAGSVPWSERADAFMNGLLRWAVERVESLPRDGGRNNAAFSSARTMAEHLAGVDVPEGKAEPFRDLVYHRLLAACEANGLVAEDGERAVRATILSGFRAGALNPKGLPDDPSFGSKEPLTPEPGRRVRAKHASSVQPRTVSWLWDGRIATGTLGLLAGREGEGKSTVGYALAAAVTTGTLPGDCLGRPRSVLVSATEDDWGAVIVPRLMAAGADLDRVLKVDVAHDAGEGELDLPKDVEGLARVAREHDAGLLLLDPLMSRLSASLDAHRDGEVRQGLEPLVKMLGEADCAALGLIHLNKSSLSDPLNAIMASKAFTALARTVLMVVPDASDESGRQKFLGLAKNNLGPKDLPLLNFAIASAAIPDRNGEAIFTSRVEWLGEVEGRSVADVMSEAATDSDDRSATEDAVAWLEDYLADNGGTASSKDAKARGKAAGHHERTLKRAMRRLRCTVSHAGFPRVTFWALPPPGEEAAVSASSAAPVGPPPSSWAARGGTLPTGPTGPTGQTGQGPTPSPTPAPPSLGRHTVGLTGLTERGRTVGPVGPVGRDPRARWPDWRPHCGGRG